MMKRLFSYFPIVAAAMVLYFSMPLQADFHFFAQVAASGDTKTVDGSGNLISCSSLAEAKDGVLLGKIVPCVIHTIMVSTMSYSQAMITAFQPLFYAFVTLVLCLFGVKVMSEKQAHREAFPLLLKITIALALYSYIPAASIDMGAGTVPGLIPSVYGAIQDGVTITTSMIGPDSGQLHCDVSKFGYGAGKSTPLIWAQMDCILGKLYGFATGGTDPTTGAPTTNMVMAASAAGLLSGFVFGGTFGVAVFFALIGVLWTLLQLVSRTTIAILNGYLIVSIMILIAPFFLPLMLMKITSSYFEKWWRAILGGVIMPIIVTAYTMFALLAYDQILLSPDSKLQTLFNSDAVKPALGASHAACNMTMTNNPSYQGAVSTTTGTASAVTTQGQLDTLYKQYPFLQNMANPLLSGANNACGMLQVPTFNVKNMTVNSGLSESAVMQKLFFDALEIFILTFLLMKGQKSIENVIQQLSAGSTLAFSAMTARSGVETRIEQGMTNARSAMASTFKTKDENGIVSTVRGADFVGRSPNAIAEGMRGFMGGVIRK